MGKLGSEKTYNLGGGITPIPKFKGVEAVLIYIGRPPNRIQRSHRMRDNERRHAVQHGGGNIPVRSLTIFHGADGGDDHAERGRTGSLLGDAALVGEPCSSCYRLLDRLQRCIQLSRNDAYIYSARTSERALHISRKKPQHKQTFVFVCQYLR